MALSTAQSGFPEADEPLRVFVPMVVDGVRFAFTHAELVTQGIADLARVAEAEKVTLTGRPRFTVVTANENTFLMGEQGVR